MVFGDVVFINEGTIRCVTLAVELIMAAEATPGLTAHAMVTLYDLIAIGRFGQDTR